MTQAEPRLGQAAQVHDGFVAYTGNGARTAVRPSVSVILCAATLDEWEHLRRAARSVREQTEAACEIIVVVDRCPALLKRAGFEFARLDVSVIPNRLEKGPSGARNTGAAEAHGDVVAFLDHDAAAHPDWIARLADHYEDPGVLGVGGLVEPEWEDGGRPRWFPAELDWVVGCSYGGMPASSTPVRRFVAANMSFRRTVLQESGGFSSALNRAGAIPPGCEDVELCSRVSQRNPGGILMYEPAAAVRHKIPRQRQTWTYLRSRCYAEGLSEARVARTARAVGTHTAERSYVRSAVAGGIWRSLADAGRGKLAGLQAAIALITAVTVIRAGYLAGRVAGRSSPAVGKVKERSSPAAPAAASPRAAARAVRARNRAAAVSWISLAVCVALWASALGRVDLAGLSSAELGLVSVLPVTFWVALAGLMGSFCWTVTRRGSRWPVLSAHVLALVAMLYATPAILYGTLRYSWAWKHVGVIDYIANNGIHFNLEDVLGVYQGWPGFFALNSFLTSASGLRTALGYAPWVLPLNDLLWLGPVILIARTFTTDKRLIWTAAWLFALGNWVGQDYFSPQAFTFFLYLTVIAVCLRWLWDPRVGPPPGMTDIQDVSGRTTPRRWVMVLCLVPLMAAIASSHQLTPLMLVGALTLLVVFRQLRPRTLPLLAAVIAAGWIFYGGLPWLETNTSQVFSGLGNPWANVGSHIVGQGQVPTGQIIVNWGARAISAAIGILALIGYQRYRRHHDAQARRSWNRLAVLAVAALPAAAGNNYGGEIIFRVYLFALPFMAVAAAAAFFPAPERGWSPAVAAIFGVTAMMLVAGFSLGNYGQEAMNHFSPKEVAASEWLYRTAPRAAQVFAADENFPWAFVHYNWYNYTFLDESTSPSQTVLLRAPVQTITRAMDSGTGPAYLILTTSQSASIRLAGTWPPGAYQRITRALLASGKFTVVYSNSDAMIMQLAR
jgi:GT2 family glycosyltransferase